MLSFGPIRLLSISFSEMAAYSEHLLRAGLATSSADRGVRAEHHGTDWPSVGRDAAVHPDSTRSAVAGACALDLCHTGKRSLATPGNVERSENFPVGLSMRSDHLTTYNSVAVRCAQPEFSEAPGFVGRLG